MGSSEKQKYAKYIECALSQDLDDSHWLMRGSVLNYPYWQGMIPDSFQKNAHWQGENIIVSALIMTRSNFEAAQPPILIDNGVAVLENEKIERHIMKNIPGGHNLFISDNVRLLKWC